MRRAIIEVMDVSRLDALVYPLSGCPAISVPAGLEEVPVGMQLLGRPFAEPLLFALAFSYEQAAHRRYPPLSAARLVTRRRLPRS